MNDFYIRPEEQETDILEINDYIYAFIEQIEVLLFTEPGEVLGDYEFGIDLQRYVHEFNINEYDLKQKISNQIQKYCPLAGEVEYSIDVFFAKAANGQDAALINITIEGNPLVGIIV